MATENFALGDRVIYTPTGIECEIIADNQTPFHHVGISRDYYPYPGMDYLLAQLFDPKKKAGELLPYVNALKREIRHAGNK